jgi:hypothetical protein
MHAVEVLTQKRDHARVVEIARNYPHMYVTRYGVAPARFTMSMTVFLDRPRFLPISR